MSSEGTPLIHLICGSTGAGKTTYAIRLAQEVGGVRFSIDDWMTALYWMDAPEPLTAAWSVPRVERCMAQIWSVASQVAARGVPAVLDHGFGQSAVRQRFIGLAREAGFSVRLYILNAPAEERWGRVEARNANKGETYQLSFDVTREMFDFVETLWEPPGPEETRTCDCVWVEQPSP